MPFGKYKGMNLDELPINYLLWLSEEADLRTWFRLQVEDVIERKMEEREKAAEARMTREERDRLVVMTDEDVKTWWKYYSVVFKSVFYDFKLTEPKFIIQRSRRWMGYWAPEERVLGINNYFILPQERFENVLIHEMCHQYVTEKGILDTSAHGRRWRNIAARLSSATGNVITICDEESYAPNRYFRPGRLVILPPKPKAAPPKKKRISVEAVEKTYDSFIEEMSNM